MKTRYPLLIAVFAAAFVLCLSAAAVAQQPPPAPTDTPTTAPTATSTATATLTPAPTPTHTPIAVLIVTPPTTPTPPSPWPKPVQDALKALRALWQTFRWWIIPILILAGLFALFRLVAKNLFDTWSKAIAAWLDDRRRDLMAKLRRGPDPTERALLQDLFDRYERLKMQGFVRKQAEAKTVSLESIYVPLFAQERQGGRLPRGGELGGLLVQGETGEPTSLTALLPRHRCLVIVGGAGSGKSTFMCHVALTLARARLERKPALVRQRLDWQPDPLPLPILVRLGGFGLFLKETPGSRKASPNTDLIVEYLCQCCFCDIDLTAGFLEARLKRKDGCLVLLDGLDEVAYLQDRVFISETIDLFARRYPEARFVVTCRPDAYQSGAQLGGEFYRADIRSLRDDDIAAFVNKLNQELLGASAAHDNAQDFLRRLQGEVRKLADNPLLLTVMIIVHFNVGTLPERRADLYDSATELLLGWDVNRHPYAAAPPPWLDAIKPAGKRIYLEELAYYLQRQNTIDVRREEAEAFLAELFLASLGADQAREAAERAAVLIDWVVERSYLLRPLDNNVLNFYRRPFQEYLAARRLAREANPAGAALEALAVSWDWWEEAVLLAVDHLSDNNPDQAVAMLRALLDAADAPAAPHRHLVLAGRALADADRSHLPRPLVDQTVNRLAAAIEQATPAFAIPLRVQAGVALSVLGDPRPGVLTLSPPLSPPQAGGMKGGGLPDIRWCAVPGGPFRMGSPPEEVARWKAWYRREIDEGRETPPEGWSKDQLYQIYAAWLDAEAGVHPVDLPLFYIARCPVTVAQFAPFVDAKMGGYGNSAFWTEAGWAWRQGEGEGWGRPPERRGEPIYWRDSRFNRPNQPVVGLTWHEAWAYCRWLTQQWQGANGQWLDVRGGPLDMGRGPFEIRLPTEAEWEKAARWTPPLSSPPLAGGTEGGRIWPWGDEWDAKKANTAEGRGDWTTTAVGLYREGASPCGALDMAGNVWQWTSTRWGDDWDKPAYAPPYRAGDGREDPAGAVSRPLRVIRGGGWGANRVPARCATRFRADPDDWVNDGGLRVVVSPVF